MYFHTFGGSALLHLLAAHPRVVALFGIAATVGLLISPNGPGRDIGTGSHLARIEAAVGSQIAVTDARQIAADRAAAGIIERRERGEIAAAIAHTLDVCGAGCTDISTARIASDAILLRRVLVLYELDKAAHASAHQAVQSTPPAVDRTR
jgi:hypothetical protein